MLRLLVILVDGVFLAGFRGGMVGLGIVLVNLHRSMGIIKQGYGWSLALQGLALWGFFFSLRDSVYEHRLHRWIGGYQTAENKESISYTVYISKKHHEQWQRK